jgi:integrase
LNTVTGTFTLPKARSKNGRSHTLPLPPAAWNIIGKRTDESRDQLFGLRSTGFNVWSKSKQALDKRSGVSDWTVHDIRRSVATGMADLGIQPHVIEQILNHQSGHKRGPAGIYNRSNYEREVRAALATWADYVIALADGGSRKVLMMSTSAS